jgi:hypothetical protein
MDERVFRRPTWLVIVLAATSAASIAGFVRFYIGQGVTTRTAAFGVVSAVLCAGVLDARLVRVVLRDDILEVVSLRARRSYRRAEIKSVRWQWGAGVALELTAGGWARLPEVGRDAQSLANSLRAWLKRS